MTAMRTTEGRRLLRLVSSDAAEHDVQFVALG